MDTLMESMNRQIQILTKDLAKAHEKLAAQPPVATPTAALAVPPSQAVAAAQHPPASLAPPPMAHPAATPLPPMATAQAPQFLQGSPTFYYEGEEPQYFRGQRRPDRRPMRCFLCDEEGTLHTAVLPELCYSTCCSNRHKSKPDGRPGGKCWNSRQL